MFSAPFCGNMVILSVTIFIHGVFSGLFIVGKAVEHKLCDTKLMWDAKFHLF